MTNRLIKICALALAAVAALAGQIRFPTYTATTLGGETRRPLDVGPATFGGTGDHKGFLLQAKPSPVSFDQGLVRLRLQNSREITFQFGNSQPVGVDQNQGDTRQYSRIHYPEVRAGVGVEFYVRDGQLEFDWEVEAHADVRDLTIPVSGADHLELLPDGSVLMCAGSSCIAKSRPIAWQTFPDGNRPVEVSYAIEGHQIRLNVASYDVNRPLTVDPVLTWFSLLGGSGDEVATKIKAAPDGGAYVLFSSTSSFLNFPALSSALTPVLRAGHPYAVVAKLSADGSTVEKLAYFGGNGTTTPSGLALDASGNVYVGGTTNAADFPVKNAFRTKAEADEGFAIKLTPNFEVEYSTFLGGSGFDTLNALAADASGRIYLTGQTSSSDFVTVRALVPSKKNSSACFITRLSATGVPDYSTYCNSSAGTAIAADETGAAYVGLSDGVVKLSSDGSRFVYTANISSFNLDINALAVDANHVVHFAGWRDGYFASRTRTGYYATISADGSTVTDKVTTKSNGASTGTYTGLAIDGAGNVYFSATNSDPWPTLNAFQTGRGAYLAKYSPSGSMIWGTNLFGSEYDNAVAIDVTKSGTAYALGHTKSADFPVPNTAGQSELAGGTDLWFAKIEENSAACSYGVKYDRLTLSSNGGDGAFWAIPNRSECTWRVSPDDNWIHPVANSVGTGILVARIHADTNFGTARTGTVHVGQATFSVYQSADTCSWRLAETRHFMPSLGGIITFDAQATATTCLVSPASSASWITVAALTVKGKATIGLQVAANGGESRVGIVTVGGQPYTVTQGASAAGTGMTISSVRSATDFGGLPSFAGGSWLEIKGTGLASTTRTWTGADFSGPNAPTILDGTKVTINGRPAFVYYVSPTQLNVQAPADSALGTVPVVVTNSNGTATFSATRAFTAAGLLAPPAFNVGGKQYLVAQLADGTFVGKAGLIPGVAFRPAKPGEMITVYGVGFGEVTPAIDPGSIVGQQNSIAGSLLVQFGATMATLSYKGLAPGYVGLYQFNIVVPSSPDGDVALNVRLSNVSLPQTVFLTIQK